MELSVAEINQRKKEIDDLANLHNLEDWQKDRLFQEYVRRKSQGYEASLLDIAKEWGWVDEESPLADVIEKIEVEPVKESAEAVTPAEPVILAEPVAPEVVPTKAQPVVEAIKPPEVKEVAPPVVEQPRIETGQPSPVAPQQTEMAQVATVQEPVLPGPAYNLDFDKIVGYKPSDGYLDPNKIAKMASEGPLEDASTWIATLVGRAAKRLGLWN